MAKIEISKESLESFTHNKNVCGISQSECNFKEIAPIDEKNVTSDWIDSIFDDYNVIETRKNRHIRIIGFIGGEVCECSYTFGTNTLQWWFIVPSYDSKTAYHYNERLQSANTILLERLSVYEGDECDLFSYIENNGNLVYQSFYFKGE